MGATGPQAGPLPEPGTVVAIVLAHSAAPVAALRTRFADAGFTVGAAGGPTFAIEASAAVFEQAFGTVPLDAGDGGWTTASGDELPLAALPAAVREQLVAVAFERPFELHAEP